MHIFLGCGLKSRGRRAYRVIADLDGREDVFSACARLAMQDKVRVGIGEGHYGLRDDRAGGIFHKTSDSSLVNLGPCRASGKNAAKTQ